MRKLTTHSKAGLFLMEMIFSVLILALACTAGIQIFAAARRYRVSARELNHIQELTSTVGEILEGCDGEPETVLCLLPGGNSDEDSLKYFYNKYWQLCSPETAAYTMQISLQTGDGKKTAGVSFYDASGSELYQLNISFPVLKTRKEAVS